MTFSHTRVREVHTWHLLMYIYHDAQIEVHRFQYPRYLHSLFLQEYSPFSIPLFCESSSEIFLRWKALESGSQVTLVSCRSYCLEALEKSSDWSIANSKKIKRGETKNKLIHYIIEKKCSCMQILLGLLTSVEEFVCRKAVTSTARFIQRSEKEPIQIYHAQHREAYTVDHILWEAKDVHRITAQWRWKWIVLVFEKCTEVAILGVPDYT